MKLKYIFQIGGMLVLVFTIVNIFLFASSGPNIFEGLKYKDQLMLLLILGAIMLFLIGMIFEARDMPETYPEWKRKKKIMMDSAITGTSLIVILVCFVLGSFIQLP